MCEVEDGVVSLATHRRSHLMYILDQKFKFDTHAKDISNLYEYRW